MPPRRASPLARFDWDAIAGVVAAGAALVLHLLHIVETELLLAIALVLLALLLIRDLRREAADEQVIERLGTAEAELGRLAAAVGTGHVTLIGPRDLRRQSEAFARSAAGEMVWFNVCLLMFRPQELFDVLLRPALVNPRVSRVRFVLDPSEREAWEREVVPKAQACGGAAKLAPPQWATLSGEAVSFILAETAGGELEAHLSFWGEPFMARSPGRDIPRYVLHVHHGSELIPQLVELERRARL